MLESPTNTNIALKIVAVSMVVVFSGIAIYEVSQNAPIFTVLISIIAILLGLYLFALSCSTLQTNELVITSKTPHGEFQIKWDEILEIEKSVNGHQLKIIGKNKHLIVNFSFASEGWEEVYAAIERHAKNTGIEIKPSFQIHEVNLNTKI